MAPFLKWVAFEVEDGFESCRPIFLSGESFCLDRDDLIAIYTGEVLDCASSGALDCASPLEKRQGAAALQDASRGPPADFTIRPAGAVRAALAESNRQA